jgi:hypothetical protein
VLRRGQRESLVRAANVMAVAGLAAVGLVMSAAVLLVTSYVTSGLPAVLWFAFPLARRR